MQNLFTTETFSKPSEEMQQLLTLLGLKTPSPSFEATLCFLQENFLRPSRKERDQLRDPLSFWWKRKALKNHFNRLGLLHPIAPLRRSYEGIVLLGTGFSDFLSRLSFALSFTMSSDMYYFLTADRPLMKQERRKCKKLFHKKTVETESEMIREITNEMLPFHKDREMIISACHGSYRANTKDTLRDFLTSPPPEGRYLLISSQPFAYYQYLVATNILKEFKIQNIIFDLAAPKEAKKYPGVVYLDTITRVFYEISRMKKMAKIVPLHSKEH